MKKLLVPLFMLGSVFSIVSCERTASTEGEETDIPKIGLQKEAGGIFTGNEDHAISLEDAQQMTTAFRNLNPEGPWGWYFGENAIEEILAQEGCVGIRIHNAYTQEGQPTPVLVGITADGEELWGGVIAEYGFPCPPC